MTDRDEHLEKAITSMEAYDVSSIEAGFAEITLSPLGTLIDSILPNMPPDVEIRVVLERIRNLKQGTFEDLNDAEFRSFLTSYLRIDVNLLDSVTRILRTFHTVHNEVGAELDLAARGGSTGNISDRELGLLLSRRQYVDK